MGQLRAWVANSRNGRGRSVDPQLQQLMKELGDAINKSLKDSKEISEVVSRIKEGATILFSTWKPTLG